MDYEKKYKEALERAKLSRLQLLDIGEEATNIEYIFPELKESDDERIRKELIDLLNLLWRHFNFPYDRNKYEEFLDWLKKQGQEQTKVSIWKHWKGGLAGNGEGVLTYLIKDGNTYSLSPCLGFECDYIELSELNDLILEKQEEQSHWKPSEEQIMAFEHFVKSIGASGYASPYDNNTKLIYSLLNDLKSIRMVK